MNKLPAKLLIEQIRESGRREGDFLRSLIADWKDQCSRARKRLSPAILGMARLLLDLHDIDAGRKFYGTSAKGTLRFYTRKREPRQIKRRREGAVLCGAKTRNGTPCQCLPEPGKARCKYHGGMSTGPKTPEGRARIAEANRRRAKGNPIESNVFKPDDTK